MTVLTVQKQILKANDELAAKNRALLDRHGVFMLNVMASPGGGKTTLILALAKKLAGKLRVGVIEGDVASRIDADRVASAGLPVVQINTEGGCHLEARQVAAALPGLPLDQLDLLVIENVGNLICTAGYDLGEHCRLVLSSVPEGHDKPYKYPRMFHLVDAVVVTKSDLIPHLEFDVAELKTAVRSLNQTVPFFTCSARSGEGLDELADWLLGLARRV